MGKKNATKNTRKIYTGLWDNGSQDTRQPFISLFSDENNAREFHKVYFQWYNIIHEFGHLLRDHYGIDVDWSKEGASEEQAVNDFAMAYWKRFGEPDKLKFIMNGINDILKRIPDPVPNGEGFLDYFNKHFAESTTAVELYGFLQFTSVKQAFYSSENLSEVLNRFGMNSIDICEKELIYTDGYHPQVIIDDCCKILKQMGVDTPIVEVVLLNNPLMHRAE